MKHSAVLESSNLFQTLEKLVDAEDIVNDKIRTHNLTLEAKKYKTITNQDFRYITEQSTFVYTT